MQIPAIFFAKSFKLLREILQIVARNPSNCFAKSFFFKNLKNHSKFTKTFFCFREILQIFSRNPSNFFAKSFKLLREILQIVSRNRIANISNLQLCVRDKAAHLSLRQHISLYTRERVGGNRVSRKT